MQNNNNKPANSARKSRGPSRKNGQKGKGRQGAPARQQDSAPVAKGSKRRQGQATIRNSLKSCTIIHEEYISDILGSVNFASTKYEINPGRSEMFPWLSAIARRYESYRFKKLDFKYEPQCATTATGTVILAVDYDAADAAPVDKSSAMSYRGAMRSMPWEKVLNHSVAGDLHKLPSNYVRGDLTLAANLDVKTYDVGNLFVITQGQATAAAVGELYVSYEVELMTPQLSPEDAPGTKISGSAGISTTASFGTNAALSAGSNIDVSVNAAGTLLTFNQAFVGLLSQTLGSASVGPVTLGGTATSVIVAIPSTTAGTTSNTAGVAVNAQPGQTISLTWTTVSAPTSVTRLSAYNTVLL